jgi:hypothetical protein
LRVGRDSLGGGGFGGFSGTQSLAEDQALGVSPEAEQNLKRLLKRDATTKLKALAALREHIGGASPDELAALLPGWLFAYARLVGDANRGVRASAAMLCGELACRARRALAPHARPLIALWYPAQFDAEPEVSAVASSGFDAAFPGAKRREALTFAAPALREAAAGALRMRTPAELPEPAATPEEGAERLARAHACALRALAALPAALGDSGDAAARAAAEANAALAVEHAWLKPFLASAAGEVRGAACAVLASLARHAPDALAGDVLRAVAPLALGAALGERDAGAQADAFDAALALCKAHGGAVWAAASPAAGSKAPSLTSRMGRLFRDAFNGNARRGAPFALPLFSLLPAELAAVAATDVAEAPLAALLGTLWEGRAAVPSGDAAARSAMGTAYAECAAYAMLRGRQAALECGASAADADAHQAALMRAALLERPLAALLRASPPPSGSEAAALAALFSGAASRVSAKESFAEDARTALWHGTADQAASAAREGGAEGARAVSALLEALHARATALDGLGAEWAARACVTPLCAALCADGPLSSAPPGVLAVMAQCVALFGPAVADADAPSGDLSGTPQHAPAAGTHALISACLEQAHTDGARRGEHASLLVSLLNAPTGKEQWGGTLARIARDAPLLAAVLAQLHTRPEATAHAGWLAGTSYACGMRIYCCMPCNRTHALMCGMPVFPPIRKAGRTLRSMLRWWTRRRAWAMKTQPLWESSCTSRSRRRRAQAAAHCPPQLQRLSQTRCVCTSTHAAQRR